MIGMRMSFRCPSLHNRGNEIVIRASICFLPSCEFSERASMPGAASTQGLRTVEWEMGL